MVYVCMKNVNVNVFDAYGSFKNANSYLSAEGWRYEGVLSVTMN